MSRKKSIKYIREAFESKNYKMVDEIYINNKLPIKLLCPKGHQINLSYTRFISKGHRCKLCSDNNFRYTKKNIIKMFELEGYEIVSMGDINSRSKVNYVCNRGHLGNVLVNNFINNKSRCPHCVGSVKVKYEDVLILFKSCGYCLISNRYINNKSPLIYKCNKGHINEARLDNFKAGMRCRECSYLARANKKRASYSGVKKYFSDKGYTIICGRYDSYDTSMPCRCPKKHVWGVSYHRFKMGARCPRCVGGGRYSSISQEWLDQYNIKEENREVRIRGFGSKIGIFVDGFDPETNTVYEFLGDYWHGNPEVYSPEDINPTSKKFYGQLYKETMERIEILKENGYNVVYIWETDYRGGGCVL